MIFQHLGHAVLDAGFQEKGNLNILIIQLHALLKEFGSVTFQAVNVVDRHFSDTLTHVCHIVVVQSRISNDLLFKNLEDVAGQQTRKNEVPGAIQDKDIWHTAYQFLWSISIMLVDVRFDPEVIGYVPLLTSTLFLNSAM